MWACRANAANLLVLNRIDSFSIFLVKVSLSSGTAVGCQDSYSSLIVFKNALRDATRLDSKSARVSCSASLLEFEDRDQKLCFVFDAANASCWLRRYLEGACVPSGFVSEAVLLRREDMGRAWLAELLLDRLDIAMGWLPWRTSSI
jgi:hypothetical protein